MIDKMNLDRDKVHTLDQFLRVIELDNENRYELVDGQIHMLASPSVRHQRLIKFVSDALTDYFKKGNCEVFISPLDVYLIDEYAIHKMIDQKHVIQIIKDKKGCKNVYQPDVFVVCDKDKIKSHGIEGAPDLVVEVISKSTAQKDSILKYANYMKYGVKEYWTVDYHRDQILVYLNTSEDRDEIEIKSHKLDSTIKSRVFDGLEVDFTLFEDWQ